MPNNIKQLVSIEERKLIQKEMYQEFGTKIKYRIMDLDKVAERMREERARHSLSPYIEIKPISPDMHKIPSRTSTFQKDPLTGILYGIPIDQDEFGNMRWQKLQIGDNLSLSLDNENETKMWAVLRFSPDIKGSPFQTQNPYYEIYDPIEVARNEMGEVASMKKAFDRADLILPKPVDMVMFARYLGEEIRENASIDIIYNTLLKFARSYPMEFNRRWENKNRSYGERFASARATGVVIQDIDRGYMFRNIPIGYTEDEAIRFMSKDPNIVHAMNDMILEKDTVIKSIKDETKYKDKVAARNIEDAIVVDDKEKVKGKKKEEVIVENDLD